MQDHPSCRKLFPYMAEINSNKANCPDRVPDRFLRETAMKCGAMYHRFFCQSYQHGTLPSHWTHALVFPVYKKARILNQRSTCLCHIQPSLAKLLSIIWFYLRKYSIITSKRHGFTRGMSCETVNRSNI